MKGQPAFIISLSKKVPLQTENEGLNDTEGGKYLLVPPER